MSRSRLPPSPHTSTRIPKHLQDSSQRDPKASFDPLPMYRSQHPTPIDAFIENKSLSAIRPTGDRPVEALFQLFSGSLSGVCRLIVRLTDFQRSLHRSHPKARPNFSRFDRANQERIEMLSRENTSEFLSPPLHLKCCHFTLWHRRAQQGKFSRYLEPLCRLRLNCALNSILQLCITFSILRKCRMAG
jgi:hypothetical protein